MSEPTNPEDAVRRALAEVAASTPNADVPPPLEPGVVVLAERRRWERQVLLAVAAVVAVVAGITGAALLTGGGDEPESVETADDTTSSTRRPSTSTSTSATSTPSSETTMLPSDTTGTTTVAPTAPPTAILATGDGWEVVRTQTDIGPCLTVSVSGRDIGGTCDLVAGEDEPGPVVSAMLPTGVPLVVLPAGSTDQVELIAGGVDAGELALVDDPFIDGLRFVVSDAYSDAMVLRSGEGQAIVGVVYGTELVVGELFGTYPNYQRASGSLSLGNFQEIGVHFDGVYELCVLVRQLVPTPRLVVNHCVSDARGAVEAVLVPTTDPMLLDAFGLVPIGAASEWSCALPSGASCGRGNAVAVPELRTMVLSGFGPISVDDGGQRAAYVDVTYEGHTGRVPVPPA